MSPTSRCTRAPRPESFITVEDGGENQIAIAAGANGALTSNTLGGPDALLTGVRSLLLQLEIPVATRLAAAQTARANSIPVVLDAAPCPPHVTGERAEPLQLTDVLIVNESPTVPRLRQDQRTCRSPALKPNRRSRTSQLGRRGLPRQPADGHAQNRGDVMAQARTDERDAAPARHTSHSPTRRSATP
ncbi:hypothetical protein [Streptomyces sp. NPDC055036]